MPYKSLRPCSAPGCPELIRSGRYCDQHQKNQRSRPCSDPGCPEIIREGTYCAAHRREKKREIDKKRESAAKRGYDARWRRLRKWHLNRHPLCVDPFGDHEGRITSATLVDHIMPLRQGGTHALENLQSCCTKCHNKKTARESGGVFL